MNKDVIYIEPEDDITDIITKLENSKEKIVALVPPKKAGVFRSIVNIKLIAKTAANAEKTVVLVTTDSSIIKLAAATRLPVTKNLQSAPIVPETNESEAEGIVSTEEMIETTDENGEEEVTTEDITEEEADKDNIKTKKAEKPVEKDDAKLIKRVNIGKKLDNPVFNWVREHKKITIGCGIGALVLILILIWAFAVAPAATVTLGIRTTTSNFSENVTFTDKLSDESVTDGKFYLEEKKIESKAEIEFEATGSKNVGEKATGELTVYTYFPITGGGGTTSAGTTFTISGLTYTADEEVFLSWGGDITKLGETCANGNNNESLRNGCLIYGKVPVTAKEPGTKYNIAASSTGWNTNGSVNGVYSDSAMSGGTDDMVTIVQQSDIDAALAKIETENESTNKAKLFDTINEGAFIIESSFKQTTGDAVSTPAVGEVVKDGEKAKLSVVTTDSVYIIDKTKVEEFIAEKAKLADNYKIYSMNDPFIENFAKTEAGYIGKLKTSYVSGPKVTENDVVEIVRGKGVGTAQHDLKDAFEGISTITIDTSFPWVSSIPNDANKITVVINVED